MIQNFEKRKEKIKSEVCTGGMSQAACNKAIAAEFDRNNTEFNKILIDLATLVPGISEADALSILLNEKTLSGDEASRIWGAIGIITAGYGQKLRLAGKELLALNSAEELVTSTGHVIKNVEANAIKSESRGVGKEAGKDAANAGKSASAKNKAGIGGNGAASTIPSLNGMSKLEAQKLLEQQGFKGRVGGASSGGWETFKHPDGSQIDINWNTGRTVRTAAPKYGPDGSRINKGQRLDSQGAEIPRNIPHDQHPKETIKVN
ncbi:hypothetical protein SALWKB12_0545 [Snodgrassella communis]|nr:hypothetical protein SALWKB12_0545 [Snodgrassella communis]